MKKKLNDIANLFIFIACIGAIGMMMFWAFELIIPLCASALITFVSIILGIGIGLYSEEVL